MIPFEEVLTGIKLCRHNVMLLLGDAKTLYRKRSYGHAISLAIIAMEEFGKEVILIAKKALPERDLPPDFDSDIVRRAFRNHDLKIQMALNLLRKEVPEGFPDILSEEEVKRLHLDLTRRLLTLRTSGLYVDYEKEKGWYDPNSEDFKEVARHEIHYIEELIQRTDTWFMRIVPELGES